MSERPASLFERPALICYCVPGGASECAPCRDRRDPGAALLRTARRVNQPAPDWKPFSAKAAWNAELDGACLWSDCVGTYREVHHGDDGCSCHISPPCGWCTETTLRCDICGDEGND